MSERLKLSLLALLSICVACTSGGVTTSEVVSAPEAELAATPAPVTEAAPSSEPAEALQQEPKQSYSTCLEFCVTAMDQAGQVTDECPAACRDDAGAYTESDLMTEDQNLGLMVPDGCLKSCLAAAGDSTEQNGCRQACCVASCELRQEYNGSGMGPECPVMCREFLGRSPKD